MAIEVGDAILKFLGDTTNVDAAFASIGPKAERGLAPATAALDGVSEGFNKAGESAQDAGAEMADAGKLSGRALREARGEAGLLGEAFGIHLPRHVRSFVAELPGVGTALSAAFSATAVLFIIQALIEATRKLSDFLAAKLILTDAMKEGQAALIAENNEVLKSANAYKSAKEELDKLNDGRTGTEKLQDQLVSLNAALEALNTNMHLTTLEQAMQAKAIQEQIALTQKQLELEKQRQKDEDNKKQLASLNEEIKLRKNLSDVQAVYLEAVRGLSKENADEIRYQASLKALQAQARAEAQFGKDSVDRVKDINAQIEKLQTEHGLKLTEELDKEKLAYDKNLDDLAHSLVEHNEELAVANTLQQNSMIQLTKAASTLGITLKSDLVLAYQRATAAQKELLASGIATQTEIKAGDAAVKEAKTALDNYGTSVDKFSLKSSGMWKEFEREAKSGASAMDLVKQAGVTAFDDLSKNIEGAFSQIVMGQGNVAKALEQATASSLASIAAQAAVKALFYTAEGLAALAGFNAGSASNYFAAAGEMAAIAVTAGVAGRVLSGAAGGGGGGSSNGNNAGNNNYSYNGSGSNTGTQASSGRSSVGVQGFAEGGLVTSPTLAMIGEGGGREAAIPLDNPVAMAHIGKAVADAMAAHGGGAGGGVHIHLPHGSIISADVMQKFVGKMNAMVNRGQLRVQASDSHKVTRRGA
jgi:hypothetical protein